MIVSVLILACLASIAFIGYVVFMQKKLRKTVEGKLWTTILGADGTRSDLLLDRVGNQVLLEDLHTGNVSAYLYNPRKTYNAVWPPNGKFFVVTIRSSIYNWDNPEPLPWTKSDPAVNPTVLGNLQDINISKMLKAQSEDLSKPPNELDIKVPMILYIAIGVVALIGIGSFFMVMNLTNLLG